MCSLAQTEPARTHPTAKASGGAAARPAAHCAQSNPQAPPLREVYVALPPDHLAWQKHACCRAWAIPHSTNTHHCHGKAWRLHKVSDLGRVTGRLCLHCRHYMRDSISGMPSGTRFCASRTCACATACHECALCRRMQCNLQ